MALIRQRIEACGINKSRLEIERAFNVVVTVGLLYISDYAYGGVALHKLIEEGKPIDVDVDDYLRYWNADKERINKNKR